MKKKFEILGCQNISDTFQCHTSSAINRMQLKDKDSIQKIPISKNNEYSNEFVADENSKMEKSSTLQHIDRIHHNFRSLKTLCKTINKFKTVHNKTKAVKKIVNKNKVNQHVNLFFQKISRSIRRSTDQFPQYNQKQNSKISFLDQNGLSLPSCFEIIHIIMNTINFFFLLAVFSFGIVFHEILGNSFIKKLEIISTIFILLSIVFNFITVSIVNGKRIQKVREIAKNYIRGSLYVDLICLIVLISDLFIASSWMRFVRVLFLCKFGDFKANIEKLQYNFINTFYREHYWGISHLMLSNFLVAHMIAIILLLMSEINTEVNWLVKAKISQCEWYEQYAWAYYWAVTTMLSIGYGDIVVSNYIQAIFMVFIQIFSCIILAYTINSVGILINTLRSKDLQKNKNMKTFKQIVDKNNISRKVEQKVGSYINETIEIKTKFNYEDQKKLLNELPKDARYDILKQCNSKLFQNIQIFRTMSDKLITQLANKIELKIAHPEEIIFSPTCYNKLQILKEGRVGYVTRQDSLKKKYVMNEINIEPGQRSRPLALNFLTEVAPNFAISSIKYSVIYCLPLQTFMQSLNNFPSDNERYFALKNKSRHITDQFEVIDCQTCKTKHTKADCPKLHYMPFRQTIIFKSLAKNKYRKTQRYFIQRTKTSQNCYKLFNLISQISRQYEQAQIQKRKLTKEQTHLNTITQVILQHLLGLDASQQKLSKLREHNDFEIKQIIPTSKALQNISIIKKVDRTPNKAEPGNINITNINNSNVDGKSNINSVFLVTNKIINQLKNGENRHKPCNYTMIAELASMMGIQCDAIKDYLHYFVQMNPKNISKRFKSKLKHEETAPRRKMKRFNSSQLFRN